VHFPFPDWAASVGWPVGGARAPKRAGGANATGLLLRSFSLVAGCHHRPSRITPPIRSGAGEVPTNHSELIVAQCVGFPAHILHATETAQVCERSASGDADILVAPARKHGGRHPQASDRRRLPRSSPWLICGMRDTPDSTGTFDLSHKSGARELYSRRGVGRFGYGGRGGRRGGG
jgi:hypothetical protein